MNIQEAYKGLIDKLVTGGIISESTQVELLKEVDEKLKEKEPVKFKISEIEVIDDKTKISAKDNVFDGVAIGSVIIYKDEKYTISEIASPTEVIVDCADCKLKKGNEVEIAEVLEEGISEDLGKEIENAVRDTVTKATAKYKEELKKVTDQLAEAKKEKKPKDGEEVITEEKDDVITEESRLQKEFLKSKNGKAIEELVKDGWDKDKVENYLFGDENSATLEAVAKFLGVSVKGELSRVEILDKVLEKIKPFYSTITEEVDEELDETDEDENIEEPDMKDAEPPTISSVFQDFLDIIPEVNINHFNNLVETFDDNQKKLFADFLAGVVETINKADVDNSEIKDMFSDVESKIEDQEVKTQLGAISKTITEKVSITDKMNKRMEKEYKKLVKAQLKAFKQKQRELKMSRGVLGDAERKNLFRTVLDKHAKKLMLKESVIKAVKDKRDELLNENNTLIEDNTKLLDEMKSINTLYETTTSKVKTLKEAVILSEAKAYLAESTVGLTPKMKEHLILEFTNKTTKYVKANITEAIDAYNLKVNEKRSTLRKTSPVNSTGNNLITEVVEPEGKNVKPEVDPTVANIMESIQSMKPLLKKKEN